MVLWCVGGANNIIIRNCRFENLYDFTAIKLIESYNVEIYNCDFINCYRGIEVARCTGKINIHNCDFKNITGHLVTPDFNCQVVQMIEGTGSDNKISLNAIENIQLESAPEDLINIYQSNFSNEGLVINKNWIRGGGPSVSGGGFLLGDNGGNNMIGEDNVLVNPGQYGIAISGGANMTLINNKVFGEQKVWSNVGLIVVDWTPEITPTGNYTVKNNNIRWINSSGIVNGSWVNDEQRYPVGWDTNNLNATSLSLNILPSKIIGVTMEELN